MSDKLSTAAIESCITDHPLIYTMQNARKELDALLTEVKAWRGECIDAKSENAILREQLNEVNKITYGENGWREKYLALREQLASEDRRCNNCKKPELKHSDVFELWFKGKDCDHWYRVTGYRLLTNRYQIGEDWYDIEFITQHSDYSKTPPISR